MRLLHSKQTAYSSLFFPPVAGVDDPIGANGTNEFGPPPFATVFEDEDDAGEAAEMAGKRATSSAIVLLVVVTLTAVRCEESCEFEEGADEEDALPPSGLLPRTAEGRATREGTEVAGGS